MRRIAAAILTLLALACGVLAIGGTKAQGSSQAPFDVIFDDARGLIAGQLVKIAGAQAGTITNVVVTPDFKARVEATVDSRFMPFHADATCTIRPEGLIAENYIDCDPGSAGAPILKAGGGYPPTVPVTNTTEPVSLLDLFNIFNLPTRERFQAIVDELGIGTAAEGQNFNDVLRRANPALGLARRAISILSHQNGQLATIVDATNTIAAQGATHTAALQSFLDRAAALSSLTAAHSGPLASAIQRLPGLLAAAQPALSQLNTVAVDGTPLVQQIHTAIPALNQVSNDLGPFVAVAKPGLKKLSTALKQAIPAIRETTPLTKTLSAYVKRSLPGTILFAKLASNLQRHGFVENFLSVTYYIAASLARFDTTSHLLSILLVGPHNGLCGNYATKPVPGCEAHYGTQAAYTPNKGSAEDRSARHGSQPSAPPNTSPGAQAPAPRHKSHPLVTLPSLPTNPASSAVQQSTQTLQSLINYLLR